jgi:hypothetical protein
MAPANGSYACGERNARILEACRPHDWPREPAVSIAIVNAKLATAPRLLSGAVICNKSVF